MANARLVTTALVAAIALASCSGPRPKPPAPVSVTVLLQTTPAEKHGTGVIVAVDGRGRLLIATARHVAINPNLRVIFRDGRSTRVLRRYLQPKRADGWAGDVALLVTPVVPGEPVAQISPVRPDTGVTFQVVGNPMDRRFHANLATYDRSARVAWSSESDEHLLDGQKPQKGDLVFQSYVMHCAGCAAGDSGAGVFDASGRLVGVLYGLQYGEDDTYAMLQALTGKYLANVPSTALIVPISAIAPLIEEAEAETP